MTDKLQADISRGQRAIALIDDPILSDIITKLRAEYLNAWEQSLPRDTDGRERVWQAYQISGLLMSHLKSIASNGTLAQAELDHLINKKPIIASVA